MTAFDLTPPTITTFDSISQYLMKLDKIGLDLIPHENTPHDTTRLDVITLYSLV